MLANISRMKFFSRKAYQPVDSEALLQNDNEEYRDSEETSEESPHSASHPKTATMKLCFPEYNLSVLFFMTLSCALAVAYVLKPVPEVDCTLHTGVYSPANEAVEYIDMDFDNAFAHNTVYRGPPTPKLEKAWEELWLYGGVRIPEEKLVLLNRTADLGGGRHLKPIDDAQGGYHALIEVFHQIHCLNLIRQYTWRDYYLRHPDIVATPADVRDTPVGARMHVDHCIEALRITLMCHGDTTPYFLVKDPSAPRGQKADFSPHHKCRNFETLRTWTAKNEVDRPMAMNWDPVVKAKN